MNVADAVAGLVEHVRKGEGDLLATRDETQAVFRWEGGQQTVACRSGAVEVHSVFPVRRRIPPTPTGAVAMER
jgi:hypothetical protein